MTDFLVGSYTADHPRGEGRGIGRARSHPDGRFEFLGIVAETDSPSWLVADGDLVHATLELASEVATFRRSADGTLEQLARVPAGGQWPCHLTVVEGGERMLLAACYGDGAVTAIGLSDGGAAGELRQVVAGSGSGPLPEQSGPRAHSVHVLPDGRVLSVDLGADRLHVHVVTDGRLDRVDSVALPPGTGPRDLLQLPGGELALLGEWSCELFILEPVGDAFEVGQILALPGATAGADQAAALALSADGRHLYSGIRGADRIAVVALDADGARQLGWVSSGGSWPRHVMIDNGSLENGVLHVANQLSSTVASFEIYPDGSLAELGDPVAVPSPTHLLALP